MTEWRGSFVEVRIRWDYWEGGGGKIISLKIIPKMGVDYKSFKNNFCLLKHKSFV